jgi:hypothetical protein
LSGRSSDREPEVLTVASTADELVVLDLEAVTGGA